MKLNRPFALLLALGLQLMPMLRAVLPMHSRAFAPPAWAMVLKLATGTVALLGSHHAVSGASTKIVKPYTIDATNGVRYSRKLACDTHSAHSWSASSGALKDSIYPLGFGLFLTNSTGRIGGIPNAPGVANIAITGWEDSGNKGRKTTSTFTITVVGDGGGGPPVISNQPRDISVVEGNHAQFSVTAQGASPLRYQWSFDGDVLTGATNATLTVSNVLATDAGLYSVRVSNSSGATNSANATLTVLFPPMITSQPAPAQAVSVGDTLMISVTTTGTTPMGFRWRRGAVSFTNVVLDSNTCVLTLPNAQANQSGLYSVVVSNAAGSATSAGVQLTVTVPDLKRPTVAFVSPKAGSGTTNGVLTVTGTAKDETGVALVEYAVGDGAFTAASGTNAWSKWSTVVALQPGTNVVAVRSVDLAGNLSLTNRRSFFSTVRVPLTLTTNGLGKVTGATNQQLLTIGKSYTLTATPGSGQLFSNWTGGVTGTALKKSFLMESNLVVTANFVPNPFLATKGVYRGLFHETNCVRNESAGYFTFTLADKGGYSAALYRVGKKHPLSGQLNLEGLATNRISLTRTTALEVTWAVDLHGSNLLTGTVSNGVWTAALLGDLGSTYTTLNPAPHAGRYTWVIPGAAGSTNEPAGDAAGTAVVDKANVVTFGGTLAEGTKVVQKVAVSRHGHWPLYVSLHSGKGSLLSWVNFDTNAVADDFSGPLCWVRPALPSLKSYTNGFNRDTVIQGSRYRPPPGTTNRVLNLTEGQLVVSGGRLTEDYTNNVFLLPNNKLTNGSPHQVTWTLKKDTGLISGTFQPTNGTRAVAWSGAVFQKTTNAFGWFLQTNQSGRVLLQAAP